MIGTTAALLGSAAIGGGSSLLGGLFGANAAKKAAEIQRNAATAAGDRTAIAAGQGAGWISGEAQRAAGNVEEAASRGKSLVYNDAIQATDPYRTTGNYAADALGNLVGSDGMSRQPTKDELQMDPGFDFRMQEGMKALERSAAARGSGLGGGALKETTRYAQDYSSKEYQNAFDRFQSDRTNRYNILHGTADMGQRAVDQFLDAGRASTAIDIGGAQTAGNFRVGGAQAASDTILAGEGQRNGLITGAANAQAAGAVGSGNAWANALSGAGSAAQNALLMGLLTKTPMRPDFQPIKSAGPSPLAGYTPPSITPLPDPWKRN